MEDVLTLNRRFGAPGRIAFREGPGGVPIAALVAPQGTCEVSLLGGQVLSYRVLGFQDALWLSPLAEFAEGKAIRGGVPVCWPWFGKAPQGFPEGTPAHGFARKAFWRVAGSEYGARDTALTLELTEKDATHPAWPHRYRLTLTVTLGDCLTLDLQTRNLDEHPFVYGEALHTYLRVGDARKVQLFGVRSEPIAFPDEQTLDEVISLPEPVAALQDPVMGRVLGLAADDAAGVVVWHPALEHSFADVPLEGPRRFVCVEPVNPHHIGGEITLAPGRAHTLTLRLQPTLMQESPSEKVTP